MQEHNSYVPYIFSAGVAAMAQALMYANRIAKGESFSWIEFLSAVFLSSFIGFLICMAAHSYGLGYECAGALAGLGGLIGKESVGIATAAAKRFLGIQ